MDDFRDIQILIIDPSGYSKNLLRGLMTSLGVVRSECMVNTDDALLLLRNERFDIVFCDENAGTAISPAAFVKALRKDLNTTNVTIPVVLVSAGTNHERVSAWRDIGGSDVIVKPVSLETLKNRFQTLVLAPRPFVTAKSFIGPDRRHAGERRQFGERRPPDTDRRGSKADEAKVFVTPSRWVEPQLLTVEPDQIMPPE